MDNCITINSWHTLKMNGVKCVAQFDEEYVSLDTDHGRINIEGNELRIEALTKERGEIEIAGKISGIFCTPERKTNAKLKLFK